MFPTLAKFDKMQIVDLARCNNINTYLGLCFYQYSNRQNASEVSALVYVEFSVIIKCLNNYFILPLIKVLHFSATSEVEQ